MTETAAAPGAEDTTPPPACQNCGTPLLGPHCYKCGQPVNGLVRHFSSILGDFADSVLNIDARVFRTLWPLLARPGYLTREYFAGHRVRYVSPVRLFVFLSIATFFIAQLMVSWDSPPVQYGNGTPATTAPATAGADAAPDAGAQADEGEDDDDLDFEINGRRWDPVANPVDVGWLPAFADRWLNAQIAHGVANLREMKRSPDQERFKEALLGAIPSTLFVLLPIFALMLKLAYFFKRRLYMEHLIVALHSHAFLCLALLLVLALDALGGAVPALAPATRPAERLLALWMPIYLLLMQKRIYGQGWPMTLLKYAFLGFCYSLLIAIGMVATVVASIVWM